MKPIRIIILILHDRTERCYGFRFIRCADGAMVEGQTRGGESNILAALAQNHDSKGSPWRDDYFYTHKQMKEKELFALPYAGSHPDDIYKWVQERLPTNHP